MVTFDLFLVNLNGKPLYNIQLLHALHTAGNGGYTDMRGLCYVPEGLPAILLQVRQYLYVKFVQFCHINPPVVLSFYDASPSSSPLS